MAKKTKPRRSAAKRESTAVESIRHRDKRKNIPTEELRDFVTDDEQAPKTVLYPRDPSLDPQLVWKGKDEQDQKDLAVPVVPIYIQEKIHPQAIIDDLIELSRIQPPVPSPQLDLFADFNGLPEQFDQRIDFYQHDANWSNRFILGDSLLVMTSLAEKEGLKGKVQTIYIDPPYGIRFGSNWQVSTRKNKVQDGKAEHTTRQPEQVRAFRDTWKLAIHSYLAYLRDRLIAARELLTETGSVFVQIGEENVHLVRALTDEVFGSENFVALIPFRKKTMPLGATFLERMGDYLLWFAKDLKAAENKYRQIYLKQDVSKDFHWNWYELADGSRKKISQAAVEAGTQIPNGASVFRLVSMWPPSFNASAVFPVKFRGKDWWPAEGQCWPSNPAGMQKLVEANRLEPEGKYLRYALFLTDYDLAKLTSTWNDTIGARDKNYVVETAPKVVERCLLMTTDPGDLVLDPTCGSGTTAYVAEQWGRRWITCDTSRVALALARTRLMAARFPYYYLADDYPQISQMAADEEIKHHLRTSAPSADKSSADIRKGFVYRRVPHVTLKSIANNPDIKEGMSRKEIDAAIARHAETETLFDQPYQDNKRVRVSGPFTVESLSPHRTISVEEKKQRAEHWNHGRSLKVIGPDDFATMIIDNLRKAGVQNTVKNERLKFDELKPYAGEWIHAEGWYTEYPSTEYSVPTTDTRHQGTRSAGAPDTSSSDTRHPTPDTSSSDTSSVRRRAAICIGPEHGTVGAQLVKEAAKEAVKGVGFDILIVCGFAFDPSVSEEARRYGKLTVLPARMNPDLAMGDELLKKTGAGNLFMVFGEPDIEIRRVEPRITRMDTDKTKKAKPGTSVLGTSVPGTPISAKSVKSVVKDSADEQLIVEIRGLDVYDPTTGEIRSSSTDDIACWFIDTAYNGESFFVRHAYFTGADEPYEKLKRALRAEIDEAAWSSLYSTTSRPFDRPDTSKIAVKVINHYGDEVMKVFEIT